MHQELLLAAYQRHLAVRDSERPLGPEIFRYEPYDLCGNEDYVVNFALPFVGSQVMHDLRSLINCMNAWIKEMRKWEAWIRVLQEYNEQERWDLRIEFVDPIAHRCMLESSAMRDRLGTALYFFLHHSKMALESDYKDVLSSDAYEKKALIKGKRGGRHLLRGELEKEIRQLSGACKTIGAVVDKMELLDNEALREETLNYRNAASHSIAPHFEFGVRSYIKRQLRFDLAMTPNDDGTFRLEEDKNRLVVSYDFGEHGPLQHVQAFQLMRIQVKCARDALSAYETLLRKVIERIKKKNCETPGATT